MLPGAVNTNRDQNGPVVVSNRFLSGINNDKDCIDQITGERFREGGCFQDGEYPPMVETLVIIEGGTDENYCRHELVETIVFSKDECEEREFTTLEEMIDEDGPENPDVDGDGQIDDFQNGLNDDGDCVDETGTRGICGENFPYELIDEDLVDADENVIHRIKLTP